jgi:hypothetical protein
VTETIDEESRPLPELCPGCKTPLNSGFLFPASAMCWDHQQHSWGTFGAIAVTPKITLAPLSVPARRCIACGNFLFRGVLPLTKKAKSLALGKNPGIGGSCADCGEAMDSGFLHPGYELHWDTRPHTWDTSAGESLMESPYLTVANLPSQRCPFCGIVVFRSSV